MTMENEKMMDYKSLMSFLTERDDVIHTIFFISIAQFDKAGNPGIDFGFADKDGDKTEEYDKTVFFLDEESAKSFARELASRLDKEAKFNDNYYVSVSSYKTKEINTLSPRQIEKRGLDYLLDETTLDDCVLELFPGYVLKDLTGAVLATWYWDKNQEGHRIFKSIKRVSKNDMIHDEQLLVVNDEEETRIPQHSLLLTAEEFHQAENNLRNKLEKILLPEDKSKWKWMNPQFIHDYMKSVDLQALIDEEKEAL